MLESSIVRWVGPFIASVVAILAPIHTLMVAVGFLIFADMATGIVAAIKREEKITSRALSRTVWKVLVYQIAVISGFAMQHLFTDALPVAKIVAGMIGCVEFLSMSENVKSITGLDLRSAIEKITKTGR